MLILLGMLSACKDEMKSKKTENIPVAKDSLKKEKSFGYYQSCLSIK
jgi:hypothetical protein